MAAVTVRTLAECADELLDDADCSNESTTTTTSVSRLSSKQALTGQV